ncbi:MFS transporter [Sphingomonas sp. Leaf339]|uniref:MFS transporter n=1 Tax=Sphingomonas sp. Leaf339 TaxID=1736343 RepID=UPI000A79A1C3|nr:MFS transporter [Sphingomonas sp. Leaf339]
MPASSATLTVVRDRASGMTGRRATLFLGVIALAHAGGVIGYLPLLTMLLPLKAQAVAGDARLGVITAAVIGGAIAASLSNILFGWLSDRSVARGGGRRGWMAAGIVATALCYIAIAQAASPAALVLAIIAFQVAINAMLAPLFAIMADEIPDERRGVAGGLLALANPVASALSATLIAIGLLGEGVRLAVIPLISAACIAPLLAIRGQRSHTVLAPTAKTRLDRDLALAWIARLLVQVAGNVLFVYLLYYLISVAPAVTATDMASSAATLLTVAYIVPLPIALLAGRLSDRIGRRKPFLLGAAIVSAAGLTGMALADSFATAATAFVMYEVGSAVFLVLHAAFAMQLLPDPRHRGRDLGLLNLTNTLPGLLGPILTWLLATPQDFDAVMLILAVLTFTGGVVMLGVRQYR